MAFPLGLTLHSLGTPREAVPRPRPPRPEGPLVWMHAPTPEAARTLAELARRVRNDLDVAVLVTGVEAHGLPQPLRDDTGPDTPAEAEAFLTHWQPDLAIFSDGEVRPAMVAAMAERDIRMMMVDGRAPRLPAGSRRWPGLMRGTLGHFAHILALDEPAARRFRKAGAPEVKVAGRMEEPHLVPPCTEAERAEITRAIAGRPVWLAAALPEGEEEAIIAAHRSVLHMSHRLLLIMVPAAPERAAGLAQHLESAGFTVASRLDEEEIQPETEIYIADNPDEFGLWYRLAPICYLGGSLTTGTLRDPLEAAGLGSAILHGPQHGPHGPTFSRLLSRRAAHPLARPADLAEALADLMAPDRVASLANAAWDVASDGSEVTDRVVALIDRLVEERL
ncbi:3-deoxy-D-manno-octulosonic acid transferase [Falsirhodobacter deserti]|uniref:3-deoxy-D-manno-octulosonic acid transferase n=1 Tax=Falsirhodobacter deserti TaxID=1365611 RepID=UPI000FE30F3F|nr:glycosyltransferase N-terminal domain-containing protein [Falsirhodobacter deserti]